MTCTTVLLAVIFLFQFVAQNAISLRLQLIPWDSPDSPLYPGNLTSLQKHQRILQFSQKMEYTRLSPNGTMSLEQIPLRVQNDGGFSYSVRVRIGNPGKTVSLLIDTGSGIPWTHCVDRPTSYYPGHSRTYKMMKCEHPSCKRPPCFCNSYNQCECPVNYGPPGRSEYSYMLKGSEDTFYFPDTVTGTGKSYPNILFGCSDRPTLVGGVSGILGINAIRGSILMQLRSQTHGKFSYCLSIQNSYLILGDDFISHEARTQVQTTPLSPTYYGALHLNLIGISVEGKRLQLPPNSFSSHQGGVQLDTGCTRTIFTKHVHDKVGKAFSTHLEEQMLRKEPGEVPNCYRRPQGFFDFPSFTYHFEGGADLKTYKTWFPVREGVACMSAVSGELTIIGAGDQMNTRFVFDVNANVLKFHGSDSCAGH